MEQEGGWKLRESSKRSRLFRSVRRAALSWAREEDGKDGRTTLIAHSWVAADGSDEQLGVRRPGDVTTLLVVAGAELSKSPRWTG